MKPGDLVKWWSGSTWSRRTVFGRVTRVTPKGTVFARYLNHPDSVESEFRGGRGFVLVTPLEVARIAWTAARPRTNHVRVRYPLGADDDAVPCGIVLLEGLACADARAAAAELAAIADWLDAMPTEIADSVAPVETDQH